MVVPLGNVLESAFHQNYHADQSNAAIHMSSVRFSPITFSLAENCKAYMEPCEHMREVFAHEGLYTPDPGRVADDPELTTADVNPPGIPVHLHGGALVNHAAGHGTNCACMDAFIIQVRKQITSWENDPGVIGRIIYILNRATHNI